MASNDTFSFEINRDQIFDLFNQLSKKDQNKLIKALQERPYLQRFEELLQILHSSEITMDEITQEVESVRQKRYNEGKHRV